MKLSIIQWRTPGDAERRSPLIEALERLALLANAHGLWVNGQPFDLTCARIAKQLKAGE
jgi:hypothetical protein